MNATTALLELYQRNPQRAADVDWYADARRMAHRRANAGIPRKRYLGVVAATSPMQQWGPTKAGRYPNLDAADRVIAWYRGERDTPGTLSASARNAARILRGEDPDMVLGPKTRNFYHALRGSGDAVVLDRWALRAIGWPTETITEHQLPAAAAPYHAAAAQLNISPAALQAATWTQIRREA